MPQINKLQDLYKRAIKVTTEILQMLMMDSIAELLSPFFYLLDWKEIHSGNDYY